jgi:hypothetical protein
MTPITDAFPHGTVDLSATRRQFLFALEQLAAHQPHARPRTSWHRRLAPQPLPGARRAGG